MVCWLENMTSESYKIDSHVWTLASENVWWKSNLTGQNIKPSADIDTWYHLSFAGLKTFVTFTFPIHMFFYWFTEN